MSKSLFSAGRAAKASRARGRRAVLETLEPRIVLNGTVVFNEISYHPADGENSQEWVELQSLNTIDFDLSNWSLRGGVDFDFPEGTILPGRGYLVIAADPDALEAASGVTGVLGPFSGRLANEGETLRLRNNNGAIITEIEYNDKGRWPVGPDGSGFTLSRFDASLPPDRAEAWTHSAQAGGTPGAANFDLPPPASALVINEVFGAATPGASLWLELANTGSTPVDLDGLVLVVDGSESGRHVFGPQTIGPGEFVTVTEAELGFGAADGDRLFLFSQGETELLNARAVADRLRGLSPEFSDQWLYPTAATPNAENSFAFHDEIVINEIMYHAIGGVSPETGKYEESPEEWIELYNRGASVVDLSGWRLRDAIDFTFPAGTTLERNEYLVVANDAAALRDKFPNATIVGNFDRGLSNGSDHIRLVDANNNPADDVRYYDSKPWPELADGGGSSLELRDPDADNSKAEAWSASYEVDRSSWKTYTIRQTAETDPGPGTWREFLFGFLDAGRALIDDVSVVRDPDGARTELIQNGTFEFDAVGSSPERWRMVGNHFGTVIVDPDDPTNRVLDLLATGPTDHLGNHAETTFIGNRSIIIGRDYEITFRAKWIGGSNQLLSRFYLSRVAETVRLDVPELHGTPGERNSEFAPNIGPTYSHLSHSPVLPAAFADVTVRAAASDPDGVNRMTLWWSRDGGPLQSVPMRLQADGMMAGTIPGQRASTVVQFYVESEDSLGATSTFPASGPNSRALIKFDDGRVNPRGTSIDTIRVVMTTSEVNWMLNRVNLMSNQLIGATIVVNNSDVYYDVDLRLKGSTFGRPKPDRQRNYNIRFHGDQLFRGVLDRIALDGSGNVNSRVLVNAQDEIIVKILMNHAGGIGNLHDDLAYVITPRVGQSGMVILQQSLYNNEYLDSRFEGGSDSPLFKLETIRYLRETNDGTPEGLKYPDPSSPLSVRNDLGDFGDNKEHYRWIYQAQNGRAKDDYDRIIELSKALDSPVSLLDAATRDLIDAEEWMRVAALYSLFGNNDSLFGDALQNVMFYVRPEDNKVILLAWDQDFSFTYSPSTALFNPGDLGRNIFQLIDLPANERMLYGNMLDLIETSFNPTYAAPWAAHLGPLIGQNFKGNVTYIRDRGNFVKNRIPQVVRKLPFEITTNNGRPLTVGEVSATLSGNGWVDVREIRLVGSDEPLDVRWTDMDSWQVTVRLDAGANDLTFEAYDYQDRLIGTDSITVSSTNAALRVRDGLRITEIMFNPADPAPGVVFDNDEFEFLELQNVGDEPIDLRGVRFERGLTFEFTTGSSVGGLDPGERILLVKNEAAFRSRYTDVDPSLIAGQFTAGRLSNGGERITLLDQFGQEILDFEFKDGWYDGIDGEGFSLTIRDAQADTSAWDSREGWRPSSFIGGSPGEADSLAAPDPGAIVINEILTHSDAVPNDWIELHNTTLGAIDVGGWLLSDDELSLGKFQIPPGTMIAAGGFLLLTEDEHFGNTDHPGTRTPFGFSELGERIILSGALPDGTPLGYREDKTFGAAERDVTFGRHVKSTGGSDFVALDSATPGAANSLPLVGPIVIHEIRYHPVEGVAEFIELKNISSEPVSLSGAAHPANTWRFTDGINFAFPTGSVVAAGDIVLVVPNDPAEFRADNDVPDAIAVFGPYLGTLSNAGEAIELSRPGSPEMDGSVPLIVVDRVNYNDRLPWPIEADGEGASLQRIVAGEYGNDAANWVANHNGGTPGVLPPQVTGVFLAGSDWSPAFLDDLAARGLGEAGFAVAAGPGQFDVAAWTGVDQIRIQFSKDVDVEQSHLAVTGAAQAEYEFAGFKYDPISFVATWILNGPIRAEKLLLELSGDVQDVAGRGLDGNWTDGAGAFPSGNELIESDDRFRFRLNVLSGDVTGDGVVDREDLVDLIHRLGTDVSRGSFEHRFDTNADGQIDVADLREVLFRLSGKLPSGEPIPGGTSQPLLATDAVFERLGAGSPIALTAARLSSSDEVVEFGGEELLGRRVARQSHSRWHGTLDGASRRAVRYAASSRRAARIAEVTYVSPEQDELINE